MYHSFQLSPPTSSSNTVTELGTQSDSYQQQVHSGNEYPIPPGTQHTLPFLPYSVSAERERETFFPASRQTPAQHLGLPPSMDKLYTFNTEDEPSEDEKKLYDN